MANAGRGELLWEPSAESVERSTDDPLHALARHRARTSFDDYAGALGVVASASWRSSGRRSGTSSRSAASAPYSRVLADRAMPGASWFEGAELNFAEHVFRDKPDGPRGRLPRLRAPRARTSSVWGELREQVARTAAGLRALGVEQRRPCRRLHAEHPGDADRLSRDRLHRGHLVELLPGLRRLRASSTASPRSSPRCSSASTATATTAGISTGSTPSPACSARCRPWSARSSCRTSPPLRTSRPSHRRSRWDELLADRASARAELRAGPGRSPALGALLVRDDRPAEGDRPGTRRHPARAPEEAEPPRRRAGG